MKVFAIALAAAVAAASFGASAHGDAKSLHGGIVQVVSDLQFELVPQPDGAAIYIVDHGKPADTTGMAGKLTVLNGTEKTEAELRPAGANKLQAVNVKVAPGSKVVARVGGSEGKALTVRFSVK